MEALKNETVSCKCLNVCFYKGSLKPASLQQLSTVDKLILVHLNDGNGVETLDNDFDIISDGAQISVPSLLTSKAVKNWQLYTCFNCKTVVYATKVDDSRKSGAGSAANLLTLVNSAMLIQAQEQKSLLNSASYFPPYRIVLQAKIDSAVKSSLKPSLVNALRQIQDDTHEFIQKEERLMLERVAAYKAIEKAKFENIKEASVQQEKQLESLVCAAFQESNEDVDSAFERSVEEISDLTITAPLKG